MTSIFQIMPASSSKPKTPPNLPTSASDSAHLKDTLGETNGCADTISKDNAYVIDKQQMKKQQMKLLHYHQ